MTQVTIRRGGDGEAPSTRRVEMQDAATQIAAGGELATEASLLLAYRALREWDPATLIDQDGDKWDLIEEEGDRATYALRNCDDAAYSGL